MPYIVLMPILPAILDRLPIIGPWRRRQALIDAETISIIRSARDHEAAYQTARDLMRMARDRGELEATRLYSKVAVRIAAVTGRRIGKGGPEPRSGEPTREIVDDQTRRRN